MKRKNQDETFNPVSFNMNLAQQVLGRKRPAQDAEETTAELESDGATVAEDADSAAPAQSGIAEPATVKPTPKPTARRKAKPTRRDIQPVSNTFRGGPRQDLRIPLDEERRDQLGDLVRQLNRKLRSRLPEAITFRALLTVLLAAEDAILERAAGSALNRTPARQDIVAATEAERDIALLLASALGEADVKKVEQMYVDQIAELDAEEQGGGAALLSAAA